MGKDFSMEPLISRIDHVSVAVRDYEKAEHFFRIILGGIPGARGGRSGHEVCLADILSWAT